MSYLHIIKDLKAYRNELLNRGVSFPLPSVPKFPAGILSELPAISTKDGWPWSEETSPALYDKNIIWPKLTIVTPSYNQATYLEQTIRSVLLQNYPNLEYIIIDGGSTDNSKEIIEKYTKWLSYSQIKPDRGQSHAINMGFSVGSGKYYAWINSDDYYLNGTFLKVINTFVKTKTNFVYGYALNFKTREQRFELIKILPLFDYFIRIPTLAQPSCFWSTDIHQPIWEELHCSLDYELWLRIVKGQTRRLLKEPLSVANVHDDAKTSNPKMKSAWDRDHKLICSPEAHGSVYNWNRLILLHKVYIYLFKLIEKFNAF